MDEYDIRRFWSKVSIKSPTECWPWNGALSKSGYGAFQVDRKVERAHRFAWQLHHPDEQPQTIMHLCNTKICCNPHHLHSGSQSENLQHAGSLGHMTRAVGTNSRLALDPLQIKRLSREGYSNRGIAALLGCEHHTIGRILKENP